MTNSSEAAPLDSPKNFGSGLQTVRPLSGEAHLLSATEIAEIEKRHRFITSIALGDKHRSCDTKKLLRHARALAARLAEAEECARLADERLATATRIWTAPNGRIAETVATIDRLVKFSCGKKAGDRFCEDFGCSTLLTLRALLSPRAEPEGAIDCGRTHPDDGAERHYAELRKPYNEPTTLSNGCGRPISNIWAFGYRCLDCLRWMHATCLRRHFESSRAGEPEGVGGVES